jgi:hypothetical protein
VKSTETVSTRAEELMALSMEATETLEGSSPKAPESIELTTVETSAPLRTELAETLEATGLKEEVRIGVDAVEIAGDVDVADQRRGMRRAAHAEPAEQKGQGNDP